MWENSVLNVGHCQGDPIKVPITNCKHHYDCNRLGVQTLGLWISANCLLEPDYWILIPEGQFD